MFKAANTMQHYNSQDILQFKLADVLRTDSKDFNLCSGTIANPNWLDGAIIERVTAKRFASRHVDSNLTVLLIFSECVLGKAKQ